MLKFTTWLLLMIVVCTSITPCVVATPVVQTITETGTWTCPQGVFIIQVKMLGGGSGGLGGNQTWNGYGGKNATLYTYTDVAVVPDTAYPITIGSGGIGTVGSSGTLDYLASGAGGDTIAFGHTVFGASGVTAAITPRQQRGYDGYGFVTLAKSGGDGTGNVTWAQSGGSGGIGYGASGGGGGSSGFGGVGGSGGQGASGVVEITYDPDASNVLFAGTIYNAQTGTTVTGATGTIVQGQNTVSINTGGGSTFSVLASSGIMTGSSVNITMSKTGYYSYTNTFVPYVSEIIPLNIAMIPTTFDQYADGTFSGVVIDQYGSFIPTASVTMVNTTGGVLSTTATAGGMWYFQNVPKLTTWAATAYKSGYQNTTATLSMGAY